MAFLRIISVVGVAITLLCAGCKNKSSVATTSLDTAAAPNVDALATIVVNQAAIEPGEHVLLLGAPGRFSDLVTKVADKVSEAKGVYLGTLVDSTAAPESNWVTPFTGMANGKSGQALVDHLMMADLVIILPGIDAKATVYRAVQEVLKSGKARAIHFHWSGAYSLRDIALEISPDIDHFYQEALQTTDYKLLRYNLQRFDTLARTGTIRVTTPRGTDISFRVGNRPITKQDGDASAVGVADARNLIDREIELPAGAIRVAPLEETVQGKIVFDDTEWNGAVVKNLVLTFQGGKIVTMTATSGIQHVRAELARAGDAGKSFREFALGFNPALAVPEVGPRWIPYYGYGAGVVRLSLGNNVELGGIVGGDYVRWNFFTDATVSIGGKKIVKDGKLLMRTTE